MSTYLLVPESFKEGLIRQLKKRSEAVNEGRKGDTGQNPADGYRHFFEELAEEIQLPEIHELYDEGSDTRISICGWDAEDAKRRAKKEYQTVDDPEWEHQGQRGVAFPGLHAVRLPNRPAHNDPHDARDD